MAGISKVNMLSGMVAVVVLMMMAAVNVVARPVKLKDIACSTADKYVYPYWSRCNSPAELSNEYHYLSLRLGGIEPEYDESNSTYYVRFTGDFSDSGARYVAVGASTDSGTLLVNSTVYIHNAATSRALQWRQEGTDEYFLIEQEVSSITEGAPFRFVQAEEVLLPCPLIYPPAQCHAYFLVSDPGSAAYADAGLLAFTESGATYIKAAAAGSSGDLPIVLRVVSDTTLSSALPFPTTIRTVTQ